jgi:hypothetical protein
MKTCKRCQLKIIDDTVTCPLCRSVLGEADLVNDELRYPQVTFNSSSYYLLQKILLFISVIIIIASIIANYLLYKGVLWSIASVGAVLYSWTIIRHAVRNSIDLASKIIVQAISGSILLILIDSVIGFNGWSVNYVVPQIAILANVGIFLLLVVSKLDWKRYVLHQMGMAFLGFIPFILSLFKIVTNPLMSYIAIVTSAIILVFTIIFGDKSLKSEITRRFHV